jgi:hypothetical protein
VISSGFIDTAVLESKSIKSEAKVPSVSPREIYFWCLLNANKHRRALEDAAQSGSLQRVSAVIGKFVAEATK